MKKQSRKLVQCLNEAQHLIDGQQWPEALALLQKAQHLDAGNYAVLFQLGWVHMQLGQPAQALGFLARVELMVGENAVVLNSVAVAYILMGQWPAALKVLLQAMALDASNIDTYVNLSSVYSNLGDHKKSLDVAMKGVALEVGNVSLHLNMGSALLGLGFAKEAHIAFETCMALQPDNLNAQMNLAVSVARQGKHEQAIEDFENYLSLAIPAGHDKINVAKYYLGYELLKTGQLEQGWALYEHGFDPAVPAYVARAPARQFAVPRWQGQPIPGQRLLVWAEQGLGDEILFLSCLRDVLKSCDDLILECAPRLLGVMARSFPGVTVRAAAYAPRNFNQSIFHDFDYHISLGSLPGLYRRSLQDFQHSVPFIVTDAEKKEEFTQRLAAYEGKVKVGICWRSGLLSAERNQSYTALGDWAELLQLPNCVFVNLQYGDCEAELTQVEARFGISIVRWPDLNLKNEIDRVWALMDCLDLVVTAPTAVHALAGSLGKTTLLVQGVSDWLNLGTDTFPWYPSTHCFFTQVGQSPAVVLPEVAAVVAHLSNASNRDLLDVY